MHGIAQLLQCPTHTLYAVNPQRHPEETSKPPLTHLEFDYLSPFSIGALLSERPRSCTNVMVWAACSLAFFDLLRVSGFTAPAGSRYDGSCRLSFNSVSVDNRDNPQQLRISIKHSKTDPFRKGVVSSLAQQEITYAQ